MIFAYLLVAAIIALVMGFYLLDELFSTPESICGGMVAGLLWPLTIVVVGVLALIKFTMETW